MDHVTARGFVRQFARNAGGDSSNYLDADVDRAVQFVGNHFCRTTRMVKAVTAVAVAQGDPVVDVSGLAGFRPEMVVDVHAAGVADPVEPVTWSKLWADSVACPRTGAPVAIAFEDWTTCCVYPTPDRAYTLRVRWARPFTTWTPGAGGSVALVLPDDVLAELLVYGPPAVLQHNEIEHAYASASWGKYLDLVKSFMGAGGLAAKSLSRPRPT